MLVFLTGDIQIGKTRWLMAQIEALELAGVEVCGVVAPGQWVQTPDGYEKLGIDNLLLPERQVVPFARRRDLAEQEGAWDAQSQARKAQLHWAINDAAIGEVNAYLEGLARMSAPGNRLLVIDELGQLELVRGGGLEAAMSLLDRGATPAIPHALVIVRESLLPQARDRFADAFWGGVRIIRPGETDLQEVLSTYHDET